MAESLQLTKKSVDYVLFVREVVPEEKGGGEDLWTVKIKYTDNFEGTSRNVSSSYIETYVLEDLPEEVTTGLNKILSLQ